jgi:hypothetical protein
MNSTRHKIRTIYPTVQVPGLITKMGRRPEDGVPLRALEVAISDAIGAIRSAGGTDAEVDSAVVYGTEALRVDFTDQLTPEEVVRDRLAEMEAVIGQVRPLLGRRGEPLPAEVADQIRRLAGG